MAEKMSQWQVATAAEALAAAQFARFGWDVSVQYGANLPEFDLVVTRGDAMLKVSVKGSQDGGWGLTQSFLKNADYHAAADVWLKRHGNKTVMCFVQFKGCEPTEMPRLYLATPTEVAAWLKHAADGRGDTVLREFHQWGPSAQAAGTVDEIPPDWKMDASCIDRLLSTLRA
ncbi:hypothetical protein GCM10007875_16140 [Limnobacter litoralis]|uniref:PD(D/E)XK endonuclease domain-containing protein n=2 Tax=Limnobacter litoralis TaxID=481366 RepID=A0ABQ5YUT2_9BURK|nr:hypothetical protein GCM10007875_16140 [Limnobacter litoralis]